VAVSWKMLFSAGVKKFKNSCTSRKKNEINGTADIFTLYERYGLAARFSINVVFGYCSHMHIFTTEYHTYDRRNEEITG